MRVDIPFKVTYEDGSELQDRIRFVDYVAAERYFGMSMRMVVAKHDTESDLFLAWNSLHRQGKEQKDFPDWMNAVMEYQEIAEGAPIADMELKSVPKEEGEDVGKAPLSVPVALPGS